MEMPLLDGFEVLAWLRSRTEFDHLPIVMLSTSDLEADILKAKGMGADDYRVKPVGSRALIALLDDLHARWLGENPQPVLVRSCPINLPATILHLPTSKSSTPDGGNNPPRRPRRPRSTPRHPSAHRRPDDHRVAA
jgi:DNA-binding response OmpR family regulator